MSKAKVQPLVPLVLRLIQIRLPLFRRHGSPLPLPQRILPLVIVLREHKQRNRRKVQRNQNVVPLMVLGRIARAINIRRDNVARLHAHVVRRGADGARANGAAVPACPCYYDRVAVGVAEQDVDDGKGAPGVYACSRPPAKGHEAGHDPDAHDAGDEGALVDAHAEPGDGEEGEAACYGGGDGEEVGVELLMRGQWEFLH